MSDLKPCPNAVNSARLGILFGMLRSVTAQDKVLPWTTNPSSWLSWQNAKWMLPCSCPACYHAGQQGFAQGTLNRFPVEDIPRYHNHNAIRAIVASRYNLNLTQLLPKIFPLYTPAR